LEEGAKKKLNANNNGSKVKSLYESVPRIEALEAELTSAGVEVPDRPKIKTLGVARDYIANLKSLLPKPVVPESKAQSRTPIAPVGSLPALAKPTAKVPAEVKNLVTSNLSVLPSLETIRAELKAAASGEQRIKLLSAHAENYRAKIKAEKNLVAQTALLRQLNRIETHKAYELYADPVAWRNRHRHPQDL
jgi:hypothetical protein